MVRIQGRGVAGTVAAKVRHLFGLCKDFGRKVRKWRRFLTAVGCWRYKMRHLQTKVGHLHTILGGSEIGCNFAAFLSFAPEINKLTEDLALGLMIDKPPVSYVN